MTMDESLKYPIGKFRKPDQVAQQTIDHWIEQIEHLPVQLSDMIEGLAAEQLEGTYRPGGWTIRQVVHHLADSHMNSYIRFRLALTEDHPVIKPYMEDKWAELPDAKTGDVNISLLLLENLHKRWALLLRSLRKNELSRTFIHPESGAYIRLDENIGFYAWHGNHHLAHIQNALR